MAEGKRRLTPHPTMARFPCTLVVRNADGEPLPGTQFAVEHAAEPMPELGYVTGPDGSAHAGLPPGETHLRFFLRDGSSQVTVLGIRDEPNATYDVTLNADGTTQR